MGKIRSTLRKSLRTSLLRTELCQLFQGQARHCTHDLKLDHPSIDSQAEFLQ